MTARPGALSVSQAGRHVEWQTIATAASERLRVIPVCPAPPWPGPYEPLRPSSGRTERPTVLP